ncbi:MAG: LacI family transcriptional regulator [Lachnospiraceae bacterium]|nr:LacI family transcriptional regulator [Lachnospiraceae bacterium]
MKKIKKRATVKDVAERAGVTIGTVSHVINGTAPISKQTVGRVRQAIEELDYVPNSAARNIRKKEKNLVGMLIPKITNSFYSLIASTFIDEADREDITVSLVGYEYSLEKERRGLYNLMQNNVDTIVIAGGSAGDEEYIRPLLDRGLHVVLADRRSTFSNVSSVEFDNQRVLSQAVGYLKDKGYATIGFLGESLVLANLYERLYGYREALGQHGYTYGDQYVFISDAFYQDHVENGYLFTREILGTHRREELPDAFIITSDLIAIGAMKAMREAGYRVPGDFGVMGFDDLEISSYVQPALTTIKQDRVLLGKELWRLVKAGRQGEAAEHVRLGQELIIRDSC